MALPTVEPSPLKLHFPLAPRSPAWGPIWQFPHVHFCLPGTSFQSPAVGEASRARGLECCQRNISGGVCEDSVCRDHIPAVKL